MTVFLSDFLAAARTATSADDDKPKFDRKAQAEILTSAFERYNVKHDMHPGGLYVEKKGLGYFRDYPVFTYVRPINLAIFGDREIVKSCYEGIKSNGFDCIVMRTMDNSGVLFTAHDSSVLEPYVDPNVN